MKAVLLNTGINITPNLSVKAGLFTPKMSTKLHIIAPKMIKWNWYFVLKVIGFGVDSDCDLQS